MTAKADTVTVSRQPVQAGLPPLGSAVVLAGAFMLTLALNPGLAAVLSGAGLLLAVQLGLEAWLAAAIAGGAASEGALRRTVRMVAPVRHALVLFAVCLVTAGMGHAGLAAAVSLCLFVAVVALEGAAVIALAVAAGISGLAALHVAEGTFGLAGETV